MVWPLGILSSSHFVTGSQEHLLRNCIGDFGQLCQWWSVEALKVGENDVCRPSEVKFSSFQ